MHKICKKLKLFIFFSTLTWLRREGRLQLPLSPPPWLHPCVHIIWKVVTAPFCPLFFIWGSRLLASKGYFYVPLDMKKVPSTRPVQCPTSPTIPFPLLREWKSWNLQVSFTVRTCYNLSVVIDSQGIKLASGLFYDDNYFQKLTF